MDILSFIIPGRLVESIISSRSEFKKKLISGIVFVAVSITVLTFLSSFFIEEKVEAKFMLSGFEEAKLPFPTFSQLLLSRIIYTGMAIAIIFIVSRLALYFIKREDAKTSILLTFIFNSFIVILISTAVVSPILITQPKAPYIIVDTELQDVTVYNGSFTGYIEQRIVTISSPEISIGYLRAYRVTPEMKIVDWRVKSIEEIDRLIQESKTVFNMSNIKWVEEGVEKTLDRLELATGKWTTIHYNVYLNAVWLNVGPSTVIQVFSMFSPISWGLTLLFISRCFMKTYQTSMTVAAILWIITYFIFFLLGLL
ncbi:MAG: hypothetical protein LZ172_03780 [Thaumarchaeota archaeon]|jgi:hypothetical protein|nr:hypothetical protein [Candidatus Geocrenenecus arthurdayi]MCL7389729.1 hypothetical protein [Candidatus Geocrenenecus arthurdayi]MCL7391075.1 hypothetical protein [Candidatus Geocrenenecus arthurdayi]MCL7396911.1 hypothetical protein [Candidatus Geocrenenecus arthurdayi]MCL7403451.1 hypothetical protein [Candidatus Geocrenenecus arthurdayi]